MRIVLVLVAVIAVVVVGFLIFVSTRPSEFRVVRSATMSASPSVVFPLVNDLRKWKDWSPWEKLDPNMKTTFEGPESGKGAMYSWVGNSNVGEGKMTITDSAANERVVLELEFFKPMAGVSTAQFDFKPEGDGTNVTWSMNGTNNFVAKIFCVFMDMDTMIGGNFEQGLSQLKAIVEKPAA
ncbi:MAG: SRPBCC family protein [Candidatus Hydrogenedentes bacterium]|nr:SRPBCC family protein [Candidatus Hydrogenedentota bacterium]